MADVSHQMGMEVLMAAARIASPAVIPFRVRSIPLEAYSLVWF